MAMIKCPECGRQISDKAPFCPCCGVAIAGKIVRCPQCGEVYFRDQEMCPNCHHITRLSGVVGNSAEQNAANEAAASPVQQTPETQQQAGVQRQTVAQRPPVPPTRPGSNNANGGATPPPVQKKKKSHGALVTAIIFALVLCGVCFYFYNNAKTSKEEEAYEYALKSDDPLVLQTYLDNYKDAPAEHIDSIQAHLNALQQSDADWTNAVVSGSKQALLDYLSKHPDSEHKAQAQHKIDSIDWAFASNANTLDELQAYLDEHANGEHVDEANDAIRKLKASTVQPEEKVLVNASLKHFFQAVNAKSEQALEASVAPVMSNFLGKQDATKADVTVFLQKIYKDDITGMTWSLGNDMKIDKREVGEDEYEYTVSVSATQDIQRTDPSKEKYALYKIKAKVNPDGLVSALSMTKIIE